MQESIVIHFKHIFMRAKFNNVIKSNEDIIQILFLNNVYCELKVPLNLINITSANLVKQLPLSKILIKTISKRKTLYREIS